MVTAYMAANDAVLKFERVSFSYGPMTPILDEVNFVVRRGAKLTLMGQNGAGKSSIFGLITGVHTPDSGKINRAPRTTIAIARQVIPREQLDDTVRAFFQRCFSEVVYDIDPKIKAVLDVVHLQAALDAPIRSFSGGQQARLLLASALIQNPDILLLDEPTNNLDTEGIAHLTDFLIGYKKTCLVISHDADFLNAFTEGVLYLDVRTRVVEQYNGDYHDVLREISARIEKENRQNAQLAKEIIRSKEKANFFAHKGGNLRAVAKKMREKAAELEEQKVDVRREDKMIKPFTIPVQKNLPLHLITITSFQATIRQKVLTKTISCTISRNEHVHIIGPNGIGKSRLLSTLASGAAPGSTITPGVRIGYYRQDFSHLDFTATVGETLFTVMGEKDEQRMRSVAASFLLTGSVIHTPVGKLSEGQKCLVAFAQLVLLEPGILILDEPTNHLNFRHIPVIAQALSTYEGALLLVSHVPEFVTQIRIDTVLDLEK